MRTKNYDLISSKSIKVKYEILIYVLSSLGRGVECVCVFFQAFHMYGGAGVRAAGVMVGSTPGTAVTYADSVRTRASSFEVIGRPLRPGGHQGAEVMDHPRLGDDLSSAMNRLRALQAELQSRDNINNVNNVHGTASNSEQQLSAARKDKVIVI